MDEASGCCGLLVLALAVVLVVAAWVEIRRPRAPEDGIGVPGAAAGPDRPWPVGPRATLVAVGLLYGAGLFLIRPRAIQAKRNGASNQQAALIALTTFALSPIVVPAFALWHGLGSLGRFLTADSDRRHDAKPPKPRGANDLE